MFQGEWQLRLGSIPTLNWLYSPPLTPYEVAVAEIHVRAISSGIAHPLALQSPLEFNGESPHGYLIDDSMDPVLQIAHNLLAFSFAARKTRILIWDWTTSELLLVRHIFSSIATIQ
jgi:hypothetical protein